VAVFKATASSTTTDNATGNNSATANVSVVQPGLALGREAGNWVLTWPSAAFEYTLESTDTLVAPNWVPVGGTPDDDGLNLSLTVPASGARKYFRLRLP
jgi:hypothetical protein